MASSGRIGTFAVIGSFWAWWFLISYPMITLKVDLAGEFNEYASVANENGFVVVGQLAGMALFLVASVTAYYSRIPLALSRLSPMLLAILAIFSLSLAVQLHDEELRILMGILYTCLLITIAIQLSTVWTMSPDDFERCMTGASVILCSFGVSAIAILGWPDGRAVGSIHPNGFSAPLLAAFIFSQFRAGWLGIVIRILCIGMTGLVSSRYAFIGCIAAFVAHQSILNPLSPRKITIAFLALIVGSAFWPLIAGILTHVLALDDPTRGNSSGFSGRSDLWTDSLAGLADHPLGVGFKRVVLATVGGHNGYLKTVLEFGVPGGVLILLCFFGTVASAGIDAVTEPDRNSQLHRFASARFGGLLAYALGSFFQPQLFSLGDAFGISLLFLLFRPRMTPFPHRVEVSRTIDRRIRAAATFFPPTAG